MPAAAQTARWIARPLPYLDECARKFGDIFTLRWVGAGTMVMVCSPELIKQVFTADADVLHAGEGNSLLEPMVGKHSLLTLDGAEHLRQRRLLLPSFHGERMQAYAGVMREVTEASLEKWPLDQPFALHPLTQSIPLDVILKTVFGMGEMAELREKLVRLLNLSESAHDRAGVHAARFFQCGAVGGDFEAQARDRLDDLRGDRAAAREADRRK